MVNPRTVCAAGVFALVWHGTALADESMASRLRSMEQRIQYLEQRVAAQDNVIVEKDRMIRELSGDADAWYQGIEIAGVVETEAVIEKPYDGETTTSFALATAELAIGADLGGGLGAEVVVAYNDDDGGMDLDSASLGYGDDMVEATAGLITLPFGVFETNMISDPPTLEIGEIGEAALQVGASAGGATGTVFVFQGDTRKEDRFDGFGASLAYSAEGETASADFQVGVINDIGESDSLGDMDSIADPDRSPVWGITASGIVRYGDTSLLVEYLGAGATFEGSELSFNGTGARPSAWIVEGAYDFDLNGMGATLAVGAHGTSEALALELPKNRLLAALSLELSDGLSLALQGAYDVDYGADDTCGEDCAGTGKKAHTATMLLGAEF